jgi:hypothetical protein
MRLLAACPLVTDFQIGVALQKIRSYIDFYTDCKGKAIPLLAWAG